MSEHQSSETIGTRLEALDARMKLVANQQSNILSGLKMMLDTLRIQSKMLEQLMKYAREEPDGSPLTESLESMAHAIEALDGSVQAMSGQIEGLPKAIGEELSRTGTATG
jgi:hypothetical protein